MPSAYPTRIWMMLEYGRYGLGVDDMDGMGDMQLGIYEVGDMDCVRGSGYG